MKDKRKIALIIIIVILVLLAIFGYFVLTGKVSFGNKKNSEEDKKISSNLNNEQEDKNILFIYTSGDNNSEKENPEMLIIYSMDDNKIDFKYHAIWNEEDVKGIANKVDTNKYVYVSNTYKVEFNIKDDSVNVKEYINDRLNTTVNLYK